MMAGATRFDGLDFKVGRPGPRQDEGGSAGVTNRFGLV